MERTGLVRKMVGSDKKSCHVCPKNTAVHLKKIGDQGAAETCQNLIIKHFRLAVLNCFQLSTAVEALYLAFPLPLTLSAIFSTSDVQFLYYGKPDSL